MSDTVENIPVQTETDVPATTSSPAEEDTLKETLSKLQEENNRILAEMQALRRQYETQFNRQPVAQSEHDEFDEVCQKILKGVR